MTHLPADPADAELAGGKAPEWERCSTFLFDSSPAAAEALTG